MKQSDKDIMKNLNELILYCKGWYENTSNIYEDILSLLKSTYPLMTKRDMIFIIMNKWSSWNETLPINVKLTIADFYRNIKHTKDILNFGNKEPKDFAELSLNVIMCHIKYIDPEYINITPPLYKKGKLKSSDYKAGMTYKEMNERAIKAFKNRKKNSITADFCKFGINKLKND